MARLQDFQSVTPSASDNLLIVQPTGQGLASFGSTVGNKAPKSDLAAPSITGSTNNTGSTIAKNQFFYLNGTLVRAMTDIANGATLTSGTNYETVTAGGLNKLNDDVEGIKIDYFTLGSLYLGTTHTNEQIELISGRRISDYDFIFLNVCNQNQTSRGTYLLPIVLFKQPQTILCSYLWGGLVKEVNVSYISDTKVSISNTEAINVMIGVFGLKIIKT